MALPRVAQITFDTLDPLPLARWWADRLGGRIVAENDGWFVVVAVPDSAAWAFQKVENPTPGKNRVHADLLVDDVPSAVEEFTAAGASVVGEHAIGDFGWTVLNDPDGNVFCLAPVGAHEPG